MERHIQVGRPARLWADTRAARTVVERRMESCILFVYFLLVVAIAEDWIGLDWGKVRGEAKRDEWAGGGWTMRSAIEWNASSSSIRMSTGET